MYLGGVWRFEAYYRRKKRETTVKGLIIGDEGRLLRQTSVLLLTFFVSDSARTVANHDKQQVKQTDAFINPTASQTIYIEI
ncbi:hypothetical protein VNO80_04805 [Phaseolus coccineus]|uniref:Uncharacterized protein n=1 Tax=Phaseolus coccineus TaxID=3886 RepID=A0AAN9NUV7_PHACN